jgi:hypothetical protein
MNSIEYMNNSYNGPAYITLQPYYRSQDDSTECNLCVQPVLKTFQLCHRLPLLLFRVAVATFRYNFITRHELTN